MRQSKAKRSQSRGISARLYELHTIQTLQQRTTWMNGLHPLGKLLVSVLFILVTVSFPKYALVPVLSMGIYLIFGFIVGELSLLDGLYRMRLILPLVIFVGILNPFFDRTPVAVWGGITITGGMLSMISLMVKGVYAVLSAYILIATTYIEDICGALRILHVPKIIILVVLLIDRYFIIMGEEAGHIMDAYSLRAPSQRGVHYSAWGTLVGQWLLRSMDRASAVYDSMLLRGFNGDFSLTTKKLSPSDIVYPFFFIALFLLLRYTDAIYMIGNLFI